jgi:hypothetical protein
MEKIRFKDNLWALKLFILIHQTKAGQNFDKFLLSIWAILKPVVGQAFAYLH